MSLPPDHRGSRRGRARAAVLVATLAATGTAIVVSAAGAAAVPARADLTATTAAAVWGGNSANTTGGKDYYVDATAGSDANAGTSTTAPWKTLTKASSVTFAAGDRILLKAGQTWAGQQLSPMGSGTSGHPITIDAYGSTAAAKPYISTNGQVPSPFNADGSKNPDTVGMTGAVNLRNQQYWTITNLQLSNDDDMNSDMVTGNVIRDGVSVSVNADLFPANTPVASTVMHGITVTGVDVHNVDVPNSWQKIYAAGVDFQIFGSQQYGAYAAGGYHFEDVSIRDNTFVDVELNAIQFGFNWFGDAQGETDSTGKFHEGWEQLWIKDRNLYNVNVYIGHNYAQDIGQGVYQFAGTKDLVAEYNEGNGWLQRYNGVSAGLYLWAGADSVMRYNEIYGGPAQQYDATPWDLEFTNFNVTYEYNYSHDNLGGWMSYMGNSGNSIARYNLSVNDNGVLWKNMLSTNYSPTYVTNNVFIYDGAKLNAFHDAVLKDTVYFLNNVFYNSSKTTTTTWQTSAGALAKGVFSNNDFYEASGKHSSDEPTGTGNIRTDPRFVQDPSTYAKNAGVANIATSAARFDLQPGSPLIDAGRYNAHLGTADFFGNGVYYGSAPDIGIEEVPTGTRVTDPVDTNPIENQGSDGRVDLAKGAAVTVSSQHPGANLAASNLTDDDDTTRWAAEDSPTYPLTIDLDFGSTKAFNEVDLSEYTDSGTAARIDGFTLQSWDPTTSTWTTFASGNGVGANKVVDGFGTVSSSKLRLSIDGLLPGQSFGPTMSEIRVYGPSVTNPTVTVVSGTYDRNTAQQNNPANVVSADVALGGDTVQTINYVTPAGAIVQPLGTSDYTTAATSTATTIRYTLTRSFLAGKQLGSSGLRFSFTSGKTVTVSFTVVDTTATTTAPTPPTTGTTTPPTTPPTTGSRPGGATPTPASGTALVVAGAGGELASTGASVAWWFGLGLALLVVGLVLVALPLRRPIRQH